MRAMGVAGPLLVFRGHADRSCDTRVEGTGDPSVCVAHPDNQYLAIGKAKGVYQLPGLFRYLSSSVSVERMSQVSWSRPSFSVSMLFRNWYSSGSLP